ncbi:hypothetical protein COLO4_01085 [Corchorus olitorius]|uniref:Uncharacterized protein n=1 Tax=Corchorus olitorius TaxID=93759 RepID=A0A1R3L301_9ROSI|nr:hypothetical protein COLO4_01085 [Corchorus olitorius]
MGAYTRNRRGVSSATACIFIRARRRTTRAR